tara:strand:+ start:66 stop:362 length:297 start_codon:yes stop_codon:yes gene_type:complete
MKKLNNEQIKEVKEIKFILNLLNQEPMTIGRLKNYCNKKHKKSFGYEMTFEVAEKHIAFLLSQGMIVKQKEQGGDGWNTSYEYEVFVLNNWWGELLTK